MAVALSPFDGARPRNQRGFTLIEAMITVAVIGILATIAFPSYNEYIRRSRIAEATGDLAAVRVRLEQFYQDNRNYGSTAAACGVVMPVSGSGAFNYTCRWGGTSSSQSFIVTANGIGSMAGYAFTVDNNNNRATTAFVGASSLPLACWITKAGGSC